MFLDTNTLVVILAVAFFASILHGATGVAGGLVMAGIFSHLMGIKIAIPVVTCALAISHFSRGLMLQKNTDWGAVRRVLLFGSPMIVLGAIIFGYISPKIIALIFGGVLITSFPIKYWARNRGVKTGPRLLAGASMVWGMLAGHVIGPGVFLAPFLQGTGMNRLAFAGTLATITLAMNILKLIVFGATELINIELLTLGFFVGLATVPGNYMGKKILEKMSDGDHRKIIDVLTILLIFSFFYLAIFI